MRSFSLSSSLRVRLLFLVLLAIIPAFGLILYAAREQRSAAAESAKQEALKLAWDAVQKQLQIVSEARRYLSRLAQRPEVDPNKLRICSTFLASELKKNRRYTSIAATDLYGNVVCTGLPHSPLSGVADRLYFQKTIKTHDFSVGNYQIGRVTGKANIGFGYPNFDPTGKFQGIVFTTLDLSWLNEVVTKLNKPAHPDTVLSVIDQNGTILARSVDSDKWVGKALPEYQFVRTILSQKREGTVEGFGVDGVRRLYAFAPLSISEDVPAYISVGISTVRAYANLKRTVTLQLAALALITALILAITWVGSDLLILRQVNAFVGAANRLAAGDLTARTGLYYRKGELGHLAQTFDGMAEAIEARKADLQRAKEVVQQNLERLRALHDINLAITSTLDLKAILDVLFDKIDLALPFFATTVRLFNKHTGELEPVACRNLNEQEWKQIKGNRLHGLAKIVLENKIAVTASNLQTDPRTSDSDFARREGLVSYIGVPLIAKDETLGLIAFYTKEVHSFADDEIEFLTTLAGEAAIAIYNSQLFEKIDFSNVELQKTARYLGRLLKQLGGLYTALAPIAPASSTDEMMDEIVERIVDATGADAALIRVWDKNADNYPVIAQRGFPDDYRKRVISASRGGAVNWVIKHCEAIITPDIGADPRFKGKAQLQLGVCSCALLPLKVHEEVRGVIHICSRKLGYFDDQQKDHLVAIARQMSIALENRELFYDLKSSRDELETANQVKDQFLNVISHELRTPLNIVIGYSRLLKERIFGEINPEQEKALEKVLARANDQLFMTDRILEVTKIETNTVTVERQEVNLSELLDEIRLGYELPIEKELTLNWEYFSDLPVIKSDDEKLKRILHSLISNAIKFTEKGNVTISGRYIPETMIVEFKVSDTGIGIPKEKMPVIFEMFRQVDSSNTRRHEGAGIGLYIVKKYTELLGGNIDVQSEPDKGSAFTITIPIKSHISHIPDDLRQIAIGGDA